nr:hypothetical protein CFP56_76929 [Quercus suber]
MEAEGGSGDPRKMDVYGSNGGNLNKQILDFEEIIRDTGEANQYDPGVSNLKRDIPNKLLNKIGNSSNQEVDGVSGNITKHTEDECLESEGKEKKVGLCIGYTRMDGPLPYCEAVPPILIGVRSFTVAPSYDLKTSKDEGQEIVQV